MSVFQTLPTNITQKIVSYLVPTDDNDEGERISYLDPLLMVSSSWRNEALKHMSATVYIDSLNNCWFIALGYLQYVEFLETLNETHLSSLIRKVCIVVSEDSVYKHGSSNDLIKFIQHARFPMALSIHLVIEIDEIYVRYYADGVESDHGYMSDANTWYDAGDNSDSYNRDVDIRFKRNKKYESKVLRFIQYVKEMVPNAQKVSLSLSSKFMRCFSKFDGMAEALYSIFEQVPDCSLSIYYSNYPRGALGLPGFKLSVLDIVCHENNPVTEELVKCHADTLKDLRILFTGCMNYSFITAVGLDEKIVYPNLKKLCVIPFVDTADRNSDIEDTQDYIPFPKLRHLVLSRPCYDLVEPITRGNQAHITRW